MAKLKGQVLVDRFCDRMGWAKGAAGSGAAERVNALLELNAAAQRIGQAGSLLYLGVDTTITQANANDFADVSALTPVIDISKQATLGLPGGRKGALIFLDRDKFRTAPMDEYGAWNTTIPSYWTWGATTAGALKIVFDRVNGTGGNLVYPFTYQQIEATIVDDNATNFLLPEGYEETLLLPIAEMRSKRKLGYAGWKELHAELFGDDESRDSGRVGRFFDQWRASKEDPKPDSEVVARAQSAQLSEGT
jgi:hypothetical protein